MQNRATINLFLGTCMCVCAYIIRYCTRRAFHVQFHEDKTDTPQSAQQFVKMFHFEEFDVLAVLRKPLTSILKTTYVLVFRIFIWLESSSTLNFVSERDPDEIVQTHMLS